MSTVKNNQSANITSLVTSTQGIALLTVILITGLMTLAVLSMSKRTVGFNRVIEKDLARIKLFSQAESGIAVAQALLLSDLDENNFDSLLDQWAAPDIAARLLQGAEEQLSIRIEDLSGRISLNSIATHDAMYQTLYQLLKIGNFAITDQGQAGQIVDSIADWIDADDSTRPEGAEIWYYQSLSRPYEPRNAAMILPSEYQFVKAIDQALISGSDEHDSLSEYLTVYGLEPRININTASLKTVNAMAGGRLNNDILETFDRYRKNPQNMEKLRPKDWYRRLPGWPKTGVIDPRLVKNKSAAFKIESRAQKDGVSASITLYVERSPGTIKVKYRKVM